MRTENKLFLQLIADHLNGRESVVDSIYREEIIKLARNHQLEGIIYMQTRLPELQERFGLAIYAYKNRERLVEQIKAAFQKEQIPFFLVKGLCVAPYYPNPELRTMGDSDIIVHAEDKERAAAVLEQLGLSGTERGSHEWHFQKRGMDVELHHALVYGGAATENEYQQYFEDCWNHVKEDGRLDWNFHFLFLIEHLRKHLLNSGVGMRQFMDLAVVTKCPEIDWEQVKRELQGVNLYDFARICYTLIEKWFGISSPFELEELSEDFYETAVEQILSNGVFGFQNEENRINEVSFRSMESSNSFRFRIVNIFRHLFVGYSELKEREHYKFLENRPYLLPYAWLKRIYYGVRHVKEDEDFLRNNFPSAKRMDEKTSLIRQWGLGSGKH